MLVVKMKSKQFEVLKRASLFLQENKCEPKVAELLLQHHLSLNKTEFITNMRQTVPEDVINKFRADLKRHVETGVPLQHLTGYEYFYNRKFHVNKDVLIPRPETEELVEKAIIHLKRLSLEEENTVIDVGTGSGVIAITLALEVPHITVVATDISEASLQLAEKNAKKHGAKVTFLKGDFLQPFIDKGKRTQMIVSNPPYISYDEKGELSRTVVEHDPELALFAGNNGLAAYETIIKQAKETISQDGFLLFEIGHTQGEKVKQLISSTFPHSEVEILKDINDFDRIVYARV